MLSPQASAGLLRTRSEQRVEMFHDITLAKRLAINAGLDWETGGMVGGYFETIFNIPITVYRMFLLKMETHPMRIEVAEVLGFLMHANNTVGCLVVSFVICYSPMVPPLPFDCLGHRSD